MRAAKVGTSSTPATSPLQWSIGVFQPDNIGGAQIAPARTYGYTPYPRVETEVTYTAKLGQDATDQKVEEIIRAKLGRKEKIPGFGLRVYRTEDPRATHLRRMSEELCTRTGHRRWFEISQKIEQVVKAQKQLNANVDFYSATTYYALGIPVDLFTPVFAVSRMSGWTAHVLEQYANNRLIRPRAEYIGPEFPQRYTAVENR